MKKQPQEGQPGFCVYSCLYCKGTGTDCETANIALIYIEICVCERPQQRNCLPYLHPCARPYLL